MQNPLAQEPCAHRRVGAIHDAEEGVLAPGAGFDEVEIALRCGIDQHHVE